MSSCTHINNVSEPIGDESLATSIAAAVTAVVLVTAESVVLLALGAVPTKLRRTLVSERSQTSVRKRHTASSFLFFSMLLEKYLLFLGKVVSQW